MESLERTLELIITAIRAKDYPEVLNQAAKAAEKLIHPVFVNSCARKINGIDGHAQSSPSTFPANLKVATRQVQTEYSRLLDVVSTSSSGRSPPHHVASTSRNLASGVVLSRKVSYSILGVFFPDVAQYVSQLASDCSLVRKSTRSIVSIFSVPDELYNIHHFENTQKSCVRYVTYRLRCIKYQSGIYDLESPASWPPADEDWPDEITICINGKIFDKPEIAKKGPIVIGNGYLQRGANTLHLSMIPGRPKEQGYNYVTHAIAIEVLRPKKEDILQEIAKKLVPET